MRINTRLLYLDGKCQLHRLIVVHVEFSAIIARYLAGKDKTSRHGLSRRSTTEWETVEYIDVHTYQLDHNGLSNGWQI